MIIATPLVSVNMAVYNGEKYIAEAIESVLDQTYKNFELIIANDGSTDETVSIVKRYQDERIRLINNSKNSGLANIRNLALKYSKGKYIAILDSDDIALPNRLEEQVAFMEAHPDFGLLGSWYQCIDAEGRILNKTEKYPASWEDIPAILLFHNYFGQSAVMLRKSCIEDILYRPEFPPAEDYDLWARISQRCKVWNLQKVLIHYRIHQSSTSRDHNLVFVKEKEIIINQLKNLEIEPTEDELKLHKLIHFQSRANQAYFIHKWFVKLQQANERVIVYDQIAFTHVLTNFYLKLIQKLVDHNLQLFKAVATSPLPILASLSRKEKVLFIIKCLLRWQTRI